MTHPLSDEGGSRVVPATESDAYVFLEDLRWPDGKPVCPHCGVKAQHYFLKPQDGSSRKTTRGSRSQRRVWKCRACRKQFSVLTGTMFQGSHIPVRTLAMALREGEGGSTVRDVARRYGVSDRTAWFMLVRLRAGDVLS